MCWKRSSSLLHVLCYLTTHGSTSSRSDLFFVHSVRTARMEKARRRRRVPAFGEWNYYYYSGELSTPAPAAAEWYAPAQETAEVCSDVWFRYSPPSRKPPPSRRKARRPEMMQRVQATTPARASDAGAPKKAPRTPAKAANTATVRVVRSVDADLYQVPPPDFEPDEPIPRRKKSSRSTWMACLGFSCCVV